MHSLSPARTPRVEALTLSYSETAAQCGVGVGSHTLGAIRPMTVTVATVGTLDCLTVDYFPVNHPNATTGIQTGGYWKISGRAIDNSPATGFTVRVTLPHTVDPHANAKVCKFPGTQGGSGWDCFRTDSDGTTVWLDGVTSFSDWAVGNNVGPTAVILSSLAAAPASTIPLIARATLFLLLWSGSWLVVGRRR